MKRLVFILAMGLMPGCSTMSQSLELGASMGFTMGALSTYGAHSAVGSKANLEQVAAGAGIGLGLGLLAAYLTHNSVQEERERNSTDQMELHFGDLPPSPFLIPKASKKGGK
jgi:hypothetical protein